jgi:hypothetical protein
MRGWSCFVSSGCCCICSMIVIKIWQVISCFIVGYSIVRSSGFDVDTISCLWLFTVICDCLMWLLSYAWGCLFISWLVLLRWVYFVVSACWWGGIIIFYGVRIGGRWYVPLLIVIFDLISACYSVGVVCVGVIVGAAIRITSIGLNSIIRRFTAYDVVILVLVLKRITIRCLNTGVWLNCITVLLVRIRRDFFFRSQ